MKNILCYGDSNTWGYIPAKATRYPMDVRWTGICQELLGDDYRIIEEGLSGRTTIWNDPNEGDHKNGKPYLLPCLESHKPLDLVIIMLGTNDLKKRFALSAADIANGAEQLCDIVLGSRVGLEGNAPKILLISPIKLGISDTDKFVNMFGTDGNERSLKFPGLYKEIADRKELYYMDAAEVAETSMADSIHLDPSEHKKLAHAIADKIKEIFED